MNHAICVTCGVQHAGQPERCPVCDDDRQYVGHAGQRWTTLEALSQERRTVVDAIEPSLWSIQTEPSFAIGQRGHLIQTPAGNLMWECVSSISDEALARVKELGGARAIAISHPHFYSSMVEWSRALGDAPIWIHAAERRWVMRPDPAIRFWEGEEADPLPGSGLELIRVGGHFEGFQDLLWPAGAAGRGVLLSGDMPTVAMDRRWVSFMYSYPNLVPLPPAEVRRIANRLSSYRFDRLYSSWPGRVVDTDAVGAVARSAERYLKQVGG